MLNSFEMLGSAVIKPPVPYNKVFEAFKKKYELIRQEVAEVNKINVEKETANAKHVSEIDSLKQLVAELRRKALERATKQYAQYLQQNFGERAIGFMAKINELKLSLYDEEFENELNGKQYSRVRKEFHDCLNLAFYEPFEIASIMMDFMRCITTEQRNSLKIAKKQKAVNPILPAFVGSTVAESVSTSTNVGTSCKNKK